MRTLTKKSLDELAQTMNVIPVKELDSFWGMYDPVTLSQTNHQANGEAVVNAMNEFRCGNANTLGDLVNLSASFPGNQTTLTGKFDIVVDGMTVRCTYYVQDAAKTVGNINYNYLQDVHPKDGNGGYTLKNSSWVGIMTVTIDKPDQKVQDYLFKQIYFCSGNS